MLKNTIRKSKQFHALAKKFLGARAISLKIASIANIPVNT
jgi:hypothetical protein